MPIRRSVLIALAVLLSISLVSVAQAGTRMYTGALIIETFGNDTTTGSAYPYGTDTWLGIPRAGNCNTRPYHAQETITFPTYPAATQTEMWVIPKYGGQVNDLDTNSDTVPDVPYGCGIASLRAGNPLTGSGTLMTTGSLGSSRTTMDPRGLFVPAGAVERVTTASNFASGNYYFEVHNVDLVNRAGTFSNGGGDGSFSVGHSGIEGTRKAVQTAGKNRFGGVMRLLGSYTSSEGYQYNDHLSLFEFEWLFQELGAGGQQTNSSIVTAGYEVTAYHRAYTAISGYPFTSTIYAEAFKWTTGTVEVTALQGAFPTILERKGYDSRTAMGAGQVQLVSPMLTHWVSVGESSTAAIGIMKLTIVPEPSGLAMLGAGVAMLGLLQHARRRGKR